MTSQEELGEMERLSREYVADPKGPLVGQRQSSHALIAEYAQADPIYVSKTEALSLKYPYYRTVLGDGNCGWRALAFGLFERLISLGSKSRIHEEIARLKSLNDLLSKAGWDREMYEDFVEPTFELLQQTASRLLSGEDAEATLLAAFNDVETVSAIIMHLRLVTSAWINQHADDYAPFIEGGLDVQTYCKAYIDPFQTEIEQVGLQALADAVFTPAAIAFEVLYLDRSAVSEVTRHSSPVRDASGNVLDAPTIRLLYRPGHYDLLYKAEDAARVSPKGSSIERSPAVGPHDAIVGMAFFDVPTVRTSPSYAMLPPPTPTRREPRSPVSNTMNHSSYVNSSGPSFSRPSYSNPSYSSSSYSSSSYSSSLYSSSSYSSPSYSSPIRLNPIRARVEPPLGPPPPSPYMDGPPPPSPYMYESPPPSPYMDTQANPKRYKEVKPFYQENSSSNPHFSAKVTPRNGDDQIKWTPRTRMQEEYDRRRESESPEPVERETIEKEIISPSCYRRDPKYFKPMMYDGQRGEFTL